MELNNGVKAKGILQWLCFHLKEFLNSLSFVCNIDKEELEDQEKWRER